MTIPIFNPLDVMTGNPLRPDDNLDAPWKPRLLEANFGEYRQDAIDGINSDASTSYTIRYTNLRKPEADYIIAFIKGTLGIGRFYFTPNEEVQQLWTCANMVPKWKRGRFCDIEMTFDKAAL